MVQTDGLSLVAGCPGRGQLGQESLFRSATSLLAPRSLGMPSEVQVWLLPIGLKSPGGCHQPWRESQQRRCGADRLGKRGRWMRMEKILWNKLAFPGIFGFWSHSCCLFLSNSMQSGPSQQWEETGTRE